MVSKIQVTLKTVDGKEVDLSTLMVDFINDKIANYAEPQRKGTAKGEAIGLSASKFEVAMSMLYEHKLKDLAVKLNVSYGLLRKWRTEDEFKRTVERHADEFATFFWDYVQERNEQRNKAIEFYRHQPITKLMKEPYPLKSINEDEDERMRDFHLYSDEVKKAILLVGLDRVKKNELTYISFYSIMIDFSEFKTVMSQNADKIYDHCLKMTSEWEREIVAKIKAYILNPLQEKKKEALSDLNLLDAIMQEHSRLILAMGKERLKKTK